MARRTLDVMDRREGLQEDIDTLKASIGKLRSGTAELGSGSVAELAKAVHDLSDHVLNLHQRIEKVEDAQREWTTRGWTPPPGSDTGS